MESGVERKKGGFIQWLKQAVSAKTPEKGIQIEASVNQKDILVFSHPALYARKPDKGEMGTLRAEKKELSSLNYPLKETASLVEKYYQKAKQEYSKIPNGSILFVMPSTSGKNIIPNLLAQRIAKDNPTLKIYNTGKQRIAVGTHKMESKNKGRYTEQISDQRGFMIIKNKAFENLKTEAVGKHVTIVDDVASSGESSIILKKHLNNAGVKVDSVTAALTSSKEFTRASDINRLYERMEEKRPESIDKLQFKKDITEYFAGFPRRKLTSFEVDFNRKKEFKTDRELPYRFITEGASYYRKIAQGANVQQLSENQSISKPIKEKVDYKQIYIKEMRQQQKINRGKELPISQQKKVGL